MNILKTTEFRNLILDSDYEEVSSLLKQDSSYQNKQFKRIWYLSLRFEDPKSYYIMGLYYLFGIGTIKDIGMAVASFKRAANLNDIKSLILVTKLYLFGIYLETNYTKATIYLEKLYRLITPEDGNKYNNYIFLLVYLLSLDSLETSIEFVIKNNLISIINRTHKVEFDGIEFELDDRYHEELNKALENYKKITNIKNKIIKAHKLELVSDLIKILDENNPKHNIKKLREIEASLPLKEGSSKALAQETLLIEVINSILRFQEYDG